MIFLSLTNGWAKKKDILTKFSELFSKYKDYILVVSYRVDGIPSENELLEVLSKYKTKSIDKYTIDYKYALSKSHSKEVLYIAQ
ncbi:MAG: hypothetical protein BEN18_04760 [Epulopiscium sp. Nuni2H_MBin001]|nr:MAG: hypothetical protein BEN18_04760 [Epulopiscium sp. Nuni2H_MBin001]